MGESKICYRIIKSEGAVFANVTGAIDFEDMVAHMDKLANDTDYTEGMNSYYDLTDCINVSGDVKALTGLVHALTNPQFIVHPSKTAVVVPDDNVKLFKLAEGLVKMVSKSKIEHRLFKKSDLKSACQFVGLSETHLGL